MLVGIVVSGLWLLHVIVRVRIVAIALMNCRDRVFVHASASQWRISSLEMIRLLLQACNLQVVFVLVLLSEIVVDQTKMIGRLFTQVLMLLLLLLLLLLMMMMVVLVIVVVMLLLLLLLLLVVVSRRVVARGQPQGRVVCGTWIRRKVG